MRSSRGFTLIELLITVLIIGLLAAIGLASYRKQRASAHNAHAKVALRDALAAARAYYHDNNDSYVGLNPAIFTVEPTLIAPATGAALWVGAGTDPTQNTPGASNVDPRRIRVHTYTAEGGHCITMGVISKGDMAYMVMDCRQQQTIWDPTLGSFLTFEPGTYYGSAKNNTLNVANREINDYMITSGFDSD